LVEEGEFLFFVKVLLFDGVEESLAVFEGVAVVKEDDFEEGVVGMGGFELLFGIGFDFVLAEDLFVSLDGQFAEPRSCLSQE
jgi:hypothetical protein